MNFSAAIFCKLGFFILCHQLNAKSFFLDCLPLRDYKRNYENLLCIVMLHAIFFYFGIYYVVVYSMHVAIILRNQVLPNILECILMCNRCSSGLFLPMLLRQDTFIELVKPSDARTISKNIFCNLTRKYRLIRKRCRKIHATCLKFLPQILIKFNLKNSYS